MRVEAKQGAAGGPKIDAEVIDAIFEAALIYARQRLIAIKDADIEDTAAFDRAARTAHLFIRVATEVDALSARKRKEQSIDARSGAFTEEDLDRHEQELAKRLARYARELADGLAAGSGADVVGLDAGRGA